MKYTPKKWRSTDRLFLFVKYFIHFTISVIFSLPSIAIEYSFKVRYYALEFVPTNRDGIKSVFNAHLNCVEFAYDDDNTVAAISLTLSKVFC